MRKFFSFTLLILLSLPILSFARIGEDPWPEKKNEAGCIPGSIKGVVLDSDGFPMQKIQLGLRTSGQLVDETFSDKNGRFAFPRVDAGRYEIHADVPGHKPLHKEFKVTEGMCTVLEMVLPVALPKSNPVPSDVDFQLSSPNLYIIEHPTNKQSPAW